MYDVHITSGEIESVTAFHRSIIPSLEFTLTKGKVTTFSLSLSFPPPLSFILFHLIVVYYVHSPGTIHLMCGYDTQGKRYTNTGITYARISRACGRFHGSPSIERRVPCLHVVGPNMTGRFYGNRSWSVFIPSMLRVCWIYARGCPVFTRIDGLSSNPVSWFSL